MPIRPPDNVQETRFTMGKKEAIIFDDLASSIESYNKNKLLLSAGKVGLGAIAVIGGVAGAYFVGRGLAGELKSLKETANEIYNKGILTSTLEGYESYGEWLTKGNLPYSTKPMFWGAKWLADTLGI